MASLLRIIVAVGCLMVLQSPLSQSRSPIVIVPGLFGSTLKPKCTSQRRPRFLCTLNAIQPTKLRYNAAKDVLEDPIGLKFKVAHFGHTRGIDKISIGKINSEYFQRFTQYFVDRGYKRGKSIRAAPYDWRLGSLDLDHSGYYKKLKNLVQQTYSKNSNTKVTVIAHSMGGPVLQYFFQQYSGINQKWKDKYIHAFVPINGAFGGAVRALEGYISGDPAKALNMPLIPSWVQAITRPIVQSWSSLPFLFPKPFAFGNTKIITDPKRSYSAKQYEELLTSPKYHYVDGGYNNYKRSEYPNADAHPMVPTYCVYGHGVQTTEKLEYSKVLKLAPSQENNNAYEVKHGNGDNTIPIASLRVCEKWKYDASVNGYHAETMPIKNLHHLNGINNEKVLEYVEKIVMK